MDDGCRLLAAGTRRGLRGTALSFLSARRGAGCTTGGCDLRCGHQVANVFLQELVVRVEFVVFFLDRFYAVEQGEEGIMEDFGMPALS